MAIVIKSPSPISWDQQTSIFLAGTIDNGMSEDWQAIIEQKFAPFNVLILNPRRDDWNTNWEQSIENVDFKQQVEWELEGLEKASYIFMYFAANNKSPITPYYLTRARLTCSEQQAHIVCLQGFWRRGNIEGSLSAIKSRCL